MRRQRSGHAGTSRHLPNFRLLSKGPRRGRRTASVRRARGRRPWRLRGYEDEPACSARGAGWSPVAEGFWRPRAPETRLTRTFRTLLRPKRPRPPAAALPRNADARTRSAGRKDASPQASRKKENSLASASRARACTLKILRILPRDPLRQPCPRPSPPLAWSE